MLEAISNLDSGSAIILGILGVVFLVGLFILIYMCRYRQRNQKLTPLDDVYSLPNFSYQTLFNATNGFSYQNMIGSGTFGNVYKGIINVQNSSTSIIAIKNFNLEHHGASKSFMAECKALRNIRHRNLVKVISVCSSIDYQGKDFKALVYEYMVNGSLEDWLHHRPLSLNLRQRISIAVDIASALEYLHHYQCGAPIVHCDLKPSNVLLDEQMVAHVHDFGFSKFLSKSIIGYRSNQSSFFGGRGTIGYIAPEIHLRHKVSTYRDVYSFGILLLEIFTGKRPTNNMFKKGAASLHYFVKEALPERVTEILDHALLNDLNEEEISRRLVFHGLNSILNIAITCSNEVPQERLDMRDVVQKLSLIKNKLYS